MYPPRVSDALVLDVIRELTQGMRLPSGASVRAVLHARFGSRGGVTRIYRLLTQQRQRLIAQPEAGSIEDLLTQLERMRERAERAEAREEAHQLRWAQEVDVLRRQLAELEPTVRYDSGAREAALLLRHQLRAAEMRAADLERQLFELRQSRQDDDVKLTIETIPERPS
jgi:hypothetical protein